MALVLVVDDKASNRELLRTALEHAGHEVIEAGDGESALEVMRQSRPKLVLLDIQMPGLDGYAVLEGVLADEELKRIPVVAVTAYAMAGDSARGKAAGFSEYITKPVPLKQLLAIVSNQLKAV
ncbi:MAG: response regulator [Acidobacteria bacterium]|nr:response regulator [Acidobacteriota bacterium]